MAGEAEYDAVSAALAEHPPLNNLALLLLSSKREKISPCLYKWQIRCRSWKSCEWNWSKAGQMQRAAVAILLYSGCITKINLEETHEPS